MRQQPNLKCDELKVISIEKLRRECPSPQFTKMHIIELGPHKLRSSSPVVTYRIPLHVVHENDPVVMSTYVTPLAPHSKQFRLLPDATISRKLLSILSLLLSAFGFIISFCFICLFRMNHQKKFLRKQMRRFCTFLTLKLDIFFTRSFSLFLCDYER